MGNKTIEKTAKIGRRDFIRQLGLLASLAAAFPKTLLAARRIGATTEYLPEWTKAEPWLTIGGVQEHLFPAGSDVPGAGDIRAIIYLHNTLRIENTDIEDKQSILNGATWLNDHTQKNYKKTFVSLSEIDKEQVLRQIEQSGAGRNWLSLLIDYLIEALLADPVYGGNPEGVGWKWLGHQPGFPKPPKDKTWYKLAAPVFYRRKAGDA